MHGLRSRCCAVGMSEHHGHCEVKKPAPGVTLLPRALVGWARHVCGLLFRPLPSQMFSPASSDVAVLPQRLPCVGCLGPKASFMGVESALGDHRQGLDGSQSLYRL